MESKPIPRHCHMAQPNRPFGQCTRLKDHTGDCWFPAASLTQRESDIWNIRFAHTLSAWAADRAVEGVRAHLASDESSYVKDPAAELPQSPSDQDDWVTIRVKPDSTAWTITDAINAELLKRDLPPTAGAPR